MAGFLAEGSGKAKRGLHHSRRALNRALMAEAFNPGKVLFC
jgi:hypothetical protein